MLWPNSAPRHLVFELPYGGTVHTGTNKRCSQNLQLAITYAGIEATIFEQLARGGGRNFTAAELAEKQRASAHLFGRSAPTQVFCQLIRPCRKDFTLPSINWLHRKPGSRPIRRK